MTRTLIVAALCLVIGFMVGAWAEEGAEGRYAEKLAGELRACEARLDRGGK